MFGLDGLFARTCLLSALSRVLALTRPSIQFCQVWSRQATPAGRSWWVLKTSALRTGENEFGFWPTPAAAQAQQGQNDPDGRRGQTLVGAARGQNWHTPDTMPDAPNSRSNCKGPAGLGNQVKAQNWPTPTAWQQNEDPATWEARRLRELEKHKNGNGFGIPLDMAVMAETEQWATPTVSGNHNRAGCSPTSGDGLATQVKMWPTPTVQDGENNAGPSQARSSSEPLNYCATVGNSEMGPKGVLNPAWVGQLMGYPDGWLDGLPVGEKFNTRGKRRGSSRRSQADKSS